MACIPVGQRVRLIKTAALQNMGTEPDPKRQLIHSLILRWRVYHTKRQDGAGRGLFIKSMRWTRCARGHKCRRSQATERSEGVPVVRAAADCWYVRNVGAKCRRCHWYWRRPSEARESLLWGLPVVKVIAVITDPCEVNTILECRFLLCKSRYDDFTG